MYSQSCIFDKPDRTIKFDRATYCNDLPRVSLLPGPHFLLIFWLRLARARSCALLPLDLKSEDSVQTFVALRAEPLTVASCLLRQNQISCEPLGMGDKTTHSDHTPPKAMGMERKICL